MDNFEVSAEAVINNLLEQNKSLVLEVASLRAAIQSAQKTLESKEKEVFGTEEDNAE